jgi:hypothetical protein
MPVEMLTHADLAQRFRISSEAARAIAKRLRLPRSRANDGKALISVDLAEIQHKALPGRSPGGHQALIASLKAKIETLRAEIARLAATANGHRADFERAHARRPAGGGGAQGDRRNNGGQGSDGIARRRVGDPAVETLVAPDRRLRLELLAMAQ